MAVVRKATHAGSWYSDSNETLDKQLTSWLDEAHPKGNPPVDLPSSSVRAIIAPHAGYRYSGPTAGYAYGSCQINQVKTVFLLGPSHHYYLEGCALSRCSSYETPLGHIKLNRDIIDTLKKSNLFSTMSLDQDEDEHSLEMHLPYIKKIFLEQPFLLVPILVGEMTNPQRYASLLKPYLQEPTSLFVISSDFCHWGKNFRFMPGASDYKTMPIHQCIHHLDHQGMSLIENLDTKGFVNYLEKTKNTICGRNPIILLLNMIDLMSNELHKQMRFVKYAQSNAVVDQKEFSVSYASAYFAIWE